MDVCYGNYIQCFPAFSSFIMNSLIFLGYFQMQRCWAEGTLLKLHLKQIGPRNQARVSEGFRKIFITIFQKDSGFWHTPPVPVFRGLFIYMTDPRKCQSHWEAHSLRILGQISQFLVALIRLGTDIL